MGVKVSYCIYPKTSQESTYKMLRRELGGVFRGLAQQKGCQVEDDTMMPDHVHMLLSVPPKYSFSQVAGFIKGKSYLARNFEDRKKNFSGYNFWE